jgi:hypothetical protein
MIYGNEITYLFLGVAAMHASPIAPVRRQEMYRRPNLAPAAAKAGETSATAPFVSPTEGSPR